MCRCNISLSECQMCKKFESMNFIYCKIKKCYIRNSDYEFLEKVKKISNKYINTFLNKMEIIENLKKFENNLDQIVSDFQNNVTTYKYYYEEEEKLCNNIDKKIEEIEKVIIPLDQLNLKKRKLETTNIVNLADEPPTKKRK